MCSTASLCIAAGLEEEHLEYTMTDSNCLFFCCGNGFEILEPENCHTIFLILIWWHLTSNREFITVVTLELPWVAKQLLDLFFCQLELFFFFFSHIVTFPLCTASVHSQLFLPLRGGFCSHGMHPNSGSSESHQALTYALCSTLC